MTDHKVSFRLVQFIAFEQFHLICLIYLCGWVEAIKTEHCIKDLLKHCHAHSRLSLTVHTKSNFQSCIIDEIFTLSISLSLTLSHMHDSLIVCVCACVCALPLSNGMTEKQAHLCTPALTSNLCSCINRKCKLVASSSQVTTAECTIITHKHTHTSLSVMCTWVRVVP